MLASSLIGKGTLIEQKSTNQFDNLFYSKERGKSYLDNPKLTQNPKL